MASTYTQAELFGTGSLLKQDFTANTEYTISITDKDIEGSAYLFMETLTYTSTPLPAYFSGSEFSGSYVNGAVTDNYTQGITIFPEGTSEIKWTPKVNVTGANVYIKATGNIGASITP